MKNSKQAKKVTNKVPSIDVLFREAVNKQLVNYLKDGYFIKDLIDDVVTSPAIQKSLKALIMPAVKAEVEKPDVVTRAVAARIAKAF